VDFGRRRGKTWDEKAYDIKKEGEGGKSFVEGGEQNPVTEEEEWEKKQNHAKYPKAIILAC